MNQDEAPKFTLSDIKYSDSEVSFARAIGIFKEGNVQQFIAHQRGYSATVAGGSNYGVTLSRTKIDYGDCDCYLGQNNQLCKHMLALGLQALHHFGIIDDTGQPTVENKLSPDDAKFHIAAGVRKIKPYNGPSKIWFTYQRGLDVGTGMIIEGSELLEPSLDNAKYLWKLVVKLSKKLSHGGVDDSNGTVGGAIDAVIAAIALMTKRNPKIRIYAQKNFKDETGFDFEQDLANLIRKQT